jgi:hypothetical protein
MSMGIKHIAKIGVTAVITTIVLITLNNVERYKFTVCVNRSSVV